jgi:hypothetical protein
MDVKSTRQHAREGFNLKFTSGDIWFTKKGKNICAITLATPQEKIIHVKSLVGIQDQIKRIDLLGGSIAVTLPDRVQKQKKMALP